MLLSTSTLILMLVPSSLQKVWKKVKVLVPQSCLTLCNPMDCRLPGSSVHGIFQARILEWVAIPFSKGSSQPRDWTRVYCTSGRFFTIWATREGRENMCLNTLENTYLNTLQEKKKLLSIGSRKIIIVIHFFLGVLKNILLMLCAMLPIHFSLFSGLNSLINWELLSLKTLKISHFPDSMIVHLLF